MTDQEIDKLIELATSGKHRQAEVLDSYTAFIGARLVEKSLRAVVKACKKSKKILFKKYKSSFGQTTVAESVALASLLKNMTVCVDYYAEERNILRRSIRDYKYYLDNPKKCNFNFEENSDESKSN